MTELTAKQRAFRRYLKRKAQWTKALGREKRTAREMLTGAGLPLRSDPVLWVNVALFAAILALAYGGK